MEKTFASNSTISFLITCCLQGGKRNNHSRGIYPCAVRPKLQRHRSDQVRPPVLSLDSDPRQDDAHLPPTKQRLQRWGQAGWELLRLQLQLINTGQVLPWALAWRNRKSVGLVSWGQKFTKSVQDRQPMRPRVIFWVKVAFDSNLFQERVQELTNWWQTSVLLFQVQPWDLVSLAMPFTEGVKQNHTWVLLE